MDCPWGEVDGNIAAMESHARWARAEGAEMVVFPELSVTGIYKDDRVWDLAEDADGPSVHRMQDIARRLGLFVGFGFTERAQPLPYNAYCVAGPDGAPAGIYRKNCIPKLEVAWWQGHNERPVFDVAGRQFAVAICWDTTQPDLLAEYGRERAEVVLMPHAWDADPLGADGKALDHNSMDELFEDYRTGKMCGWESHDGMLSQFLGYIPSRARENGFYALFVNQSGRPHEALRLEGPTFAVDPRGEVLVCTETGEEQMLFVEIP
jgi:predicted amidohydrolase